MGPVLTPHSQTMLQHHYSLALESNTHWHLPLCKASQALCSSARLYPEGSYCSHAVPT